MNEQLRHYYLDQIGIQRYTPRTQPSADALPPLNRLLSDDESAQPLTDWPTLKAQVKECRLCELAQSRTNTVFGSGSEAADVFVVGEAPGADEDQQGVPFVGRAGRLLDSLLQAVQLVRDDVYIANILKCRPPANRDPLPAEVAACEGYLEQQIAKVNPKVILAIGRVAAQNLLHVETPISELRGKELFYGDRKIPVIVTYHPAYLLRQPKAKAEVWKDLLRLIRFLQHK